MQENARTALEALDQETRRAALAEGLRQLAEFVELYPDAPVYVRGYCPTISLINFLDAEDFKAGASKIGRADKTSDNWSFGLEKLFGQGTVSFKLETNREGVCEKRVIGSKTVVVKKQDPEALKAVPEIEVEEVVDELEWVCPESILRPAITDLDEALGQGRN